MRYRLLIGAAGFLLAGMLCAPMPAQAQAGPWAERMHRLRVLCDQGYRPACIRFGYFLGINQGRRAEWMRDHPNWWWWERY